MGLLIISVCLESGFLGFRMYIVKIGKVLGELGWIGYFIRGYLYYGWKKVGKVGEVDLVLFWIRFIFDFCVIFFFLNIFGLVCGEILEIVVVWGEVEGKGLG